MKEGKTIFSRIDLIVLAVIVFIGLLFRLYNINTPLADLHSWRQVDTAAVGRNFVNDGYTLLQPRYDDLSSLQSGEENPEGFRMVEFPLYNAMFAGLSQAIPGLSLEVSGRVVSIVFSLFTLAIIYYLVLREFNRPAAVVAAGLYAILPYIVFFSRTVLPETTALGLAFIAIFFLYIRQETDQKKKPLRLVLFYSSLIAFAASLLVKPTTIFYALPLGYLFIREFRFSVIKNWRPYLYFALAFIPFILWRLYIAQYPEGIPAASWLFTKVNTFEGQKDIFFRPAFFRWMFFERINNMMLGGWLSSLLVVGVLFRPKRIFLTLLAAAGFIYLFTFQGGNVQHEYYQVILFPAIVILCGIGAGFIMIHAKLFYNRFIAGVAIAGVVALSWFFAFYQVRNFYNTPQDLVDIANVVQLLTDPDDLIATDRLGDTTLLYLSDRKGAPAIYKDLDELKSMGYSYALSQSDGNREAWKELGEYEVVFENDMFIMIAL